MGTVERDKASIDRAVAQAIVGGQELQGFVLRILETNRIIKHNYRYSFVRQEICGLAGCGERFDIALIPRQILYPKFCEKHRSEYQRKLHLRKQHAASGKTIR